MNRHLMVGLSGTTLTDDERDWLKRLPPLGVILFARNIESPEQVRALLDAARQAAGCDLWAAIDEEGGRVNRMPWPPFAGRHPAAYFGEMLERDPATAWQAVYQDNLAVGEALAKLGFTHNCAPVLDLFHPDGHGIIGARAYSSDVFTVARLGDACRQGLHDGGIAAVGKHFPGHGRANADSHVAVPQLDAPLDILLREAQSFARLIEAGLQHIMTAHVVYSGADNRVATFSPFWLADVLRSRFAFSGRIWSDDLSMKGAGGDVSTAAMSAREAGCDVLLVCEPADVREVYESL